MTRIKDDIKRLQQIVEKHNAQPLIVRQSWLTMKPGDQEITLINKVSSDLSSGREVFAQIVPEWSNCSIDTMDSDGYEECENSLAEPFYEEIGSKKPADFFKTDWKLIFVEHNWGSGVETISSDSTAII